MNNNNVFTIDVEDWFHILDSPSAPKIKDWPQLESRVAQNTEVLLELLAEKSVRATMFWLGWVAERHPQLLLKCQAAGHEIASHGYAHILAYEAGREKFREDIQKTKIILEDIIGQEVRGFRAPGFSTLNDTSWTFEEIRAAGYTYDSSVFPSSRGHGGMSSSRLEPYIIKTSCGPLVEFPQSMIEIFKQRVSVFGGGYLRLAPSRVIDWGVRRLHESGRPLIIYIHPREIDPTHPRVSLSAFRAFKCYHNLGGTTNKLRGLINANNFIKMDQLAQQVQDADDPASVLYCEQTVK